MTTATTMTGATARGPHAARSPPTTRTSPTAPPPWTASTADYRFAAVEATTPAGLTLTVHAGAPLAAEQEAVSTVRGRHADRAAAAAGRRRRGDLAGDPARAAARRGDPPRDGRDHRLRGPVPPRPGARLARRDRPRWPGRPTRRSPRWRRPWSGSGGSSRTPRTSCAAPIASLRTQLEVGEAHPELLDLPGAVADTVRLQGLAADLLLLARLDAGERPGAARLRPGRWCARRCPSGPGTGSR